jgi:hypothetical protein
MGATHLLLDPQRGSVKEGKPADLPHNPLTRRRPLRAAWIPCVIAWDPETGEFRRAERAEGFTTWEEADGASRFLVHHLGDPSA